MIVSKQKMFGHKASCTVRNSRRWASCGVRVIPRRATSRRSTAELGWNADTTYALIKRRIKKGAIGRCEPGFMCHALVSKEQVQQTEASSLIVKLYDGSADKLFVALLQNEMVPIEKARAIVLGTASD